MKRFLLSLFIIVFVTVFFAVCTTSVEEADPGDFEGDIQKITLNLKEIGTVPERNPEPPLEVISISPEFITRDELKWLLVEFENGLRGNRIEPENGFSENDMVKINSGNSKRPEIIIRTDPVDYPMTTIIRVESVYDPSVFAEAILTVYPVYPKNRHIVITNGDNTQSAAASSGVPNSKFGLPETAITGTTQVSIPPVGDIDIGVNSTDLTSDAGMFLLLGSGGGSDYNKGDQESPYLYVIDPEDPYKWGIVPTGAPRGGMTVFSDNRNATDQFILRKTNGHFRTGGHSRFMRIAALQGPFTIIVNYISNAAEERTVDIRIGDTEGFRLEGPVSSSNAITEARTVKYEHNEDTFVPFVFLETNNAMQIYDVIVLEGVEDQP